MTDPNLINNISVNDNN